MKTEKAYFYKDLKLDAIRLLKNLTGLSISSISTLNKITDSSLMNSLIFKALNLADNNIEELQSNLFNNLQNIENPNL
jgi:hypothetical protein